MHVVMIGYGYVASVLASELLPDLESLVATTRDAVKCAMLRAKGVDAIVFNGERLSDDLSISLQRATHIVVSAPPGERGDPLLAAGFDTMSLPLLRRVIYYSTVGVYGDHGGKLVNERSEVRPLSARSAHRATAEADWQSSADRHGFDLGILRLAGIYGPGRGAVERIRNGTAKCVVKEGHLFNRIHVADVAGATAAALKHSKPLSIFNLADDDPSPTRDVFIRAAKLMGATPPPEISFEDALLSPIERTFYEESRRVSNERLKRELGYALRFQTYREGIASLL